MGEALITRRGGGAAFTKLTEVSVYETNTGSLYGCTYQIDPAGIYSVALMDDGTLKAFSGMIVNGEWLDGGYAPGTITDNLLLLEFSSSNLGTAIVYRLE